MSEDFEISCSYLKDETWRIFRIISEFVEGMEELAAVVMQAAGITGHRLETESSEVYGRTTDIVSGPDNLEVASCAVGPHPLDGAWGIVDTWVGLGFGLERLLMVREGGSGIGRWCRSNAYLDGVRLTL